MASPNVQITFTAVNRTGRTFRQIDQSLNRFSPQLNQIQSRFSTFSNIMAGGFEAIGFAAVDAAFRITDFVRNSVIAAGRLQAFVNTLEATQGGATGAASALRELRQQARLPGVFFEDAIAIRNVFSALNVDIRTTNQLVEEFGNVLALSGTGGRGALRGILLPLRQIISSRRIDQENINQLLERDPTGRVAGSLQNIFGTVRAQDGIADAVGEGFDRVINNFIRPLIAELQAGPRADAASFNNLVSNLQNDFQQFQQEFGQVLLPVATDFIRALSQATQALTSFIEGTELSTNQLSNIFRGGGLISGIARGGAGLAGAGAGGGLLQSLATRIGASTAGTVRGPGGQLFVDAQAVGAATTRISRFTRVLGRLSIVLGGVTAAFDGIQLLSFINQINESEQAYSRFIRTLSQSRGQEEASNLIERQLRSLRNQREGLREGLGLGPGVAAPDPNRSILGGLGRALGFGREDFRQSILLQNVNRDISRLRDNLQSLSREGFQAFVRDQVAILRAQVAAAERTSDERLPEIRASYEAWLETLKAINQENAQLERENATRVLQERLQDLNIEAERTEVSIAGILQELQTTGSLPRIEQLDNDLLALSQLAQSLQFQLANLDPETTDLERFQISTDTLNRLNQFAEAIQSARQRVIDQLQQANLDNVRADQELLRAAQVRIDASLNRARTAQQAALQAVQEAVALEADLARRTTEDLQQRQENLLPGGRTVGQITEQLRSLNTEVVRSLENERRIAIAAIPSETAPALREIQEEGIRQRFQTSIDSQNRRTQQIIEGFEQATTEAGRQEEQNRLDLQNQAAQRRLSNIENVESNVTAIRSAAEQARIADAEATESRITAIQNNENLTRGQISSQVAQERANLRARDVESEEEVQRRITGIYRQGEEERTDISEEAQRIREEIRQDALRQEANQGFNAGFFGTGLRRQLSQRLNALRELEREQLNSLLNQDLDPDVQSAREEQIRAQTNNAINSVIQSAESAQPRISQILNQTSQQLGNVALNSFLQLPRQQDRALEDLQRDTQQRIQEIRDNELLSVQEQNQRIEELEEQSARRRADIERNFSRQRIDSFRNVGVALAQALAREVIDFIAAQTTKRLVAFATNNAIAQSNLFGLGAGAAGIAGVAIPGALAVGGAILLASQLSDGRLFHSEFADLQARNLGADLRRNIEQNNRQSAQDFLSNVRQGVNEPSPAAPQEQQPQRMEIRIPIDFRFPDEVIRATEARKIVLIDKGVIVEEDE